MRRAFLFILCCLLLASPVLAASGVTSAQSHTVVDTDGSCQVTLTLALQLDSPASSLVFPLPVKARDITVNGAPVSAPVSGTVRNAELSGIVSAAGPYTLTVRYTLPDAVTASRTGVLTLSLELLSGFGYPVDTLDFTVILPGAFEGKPIFASTYYQDAVDTVLTYTVKDGQITGSVPGGLKDHEVLSMQLPVTAEMFPQNAVKRWSMDSLDLMMILCALLAFCYWLVSLRFMPYRAARQTAAPEGFTAGEVGCQLTGTAVDFSLTVISWAQMGYLQIRRDGADRVLLQKRMEMGNERSDFENKYFRRLFGRRMTVEGTGFHYARVCRKANSRCVGVSANYLRSSGNARIFRGLCCLLGTLSGVSLAFAFSGDTTARTLLSILLGLVGTVAAWQIQEIGFCLHVRSKRQLWFGVGWSAFWLLLSYLAGEWNVAAIVIPALILAGAAGAYGGRRSEIGKQNLSDLLGLRRYLKTVSPQELRAIMSGNPDYFYQLAPWALALDADRAFADRFGQSRLPQCSYLITGSDSRLTAREWSRLLRDVVNLLDQKQKRLALEQLLGK